MLMRSVCARYGEAIEFTKQSVITIGIALVFFVNFFAATIISRPDTFTGIEYALWVRWPLVLALGTIALGTLAVLLFRAMSCIDSGYEG